MRSPGPKLTVAIVSFNTRELLLAGLESLAADAESGLVDVWVVDNGSADGSQAAVRAGAPWARLIEAPSNLGFGTAVNLVARRTTGDWLLAANADVAFESGAITALLGAGATARIGCVAPRLLLPGGATEHSVHPFPTVALTLLFNLGVHRLSPSLAERLCLEGFWRPDRPREVPWALGACLLLRRRAFEQAGMFDERQWMYAEDLELGWRLRDHGWATYYEPAARVQHASGASTEKVFAGEQRERFLAATYVLLARRRGASRMWMTAIVNVLGAVLRVIWMTPLAVLRPDWRARAADSRAWFWAHVRAIRLRSTLREPL